MILSKYRNGSEIIALNPSHIFCVNFLLKKLQLQNQNHNSNSSV